MAKKIVTYGFNEKIYLVTYKNISTASSKTNKLQNSQWLLCSFYKLIILNIVLVKKSRDFFGFTFFNNFLKFAKL